MSVVPVLGRQRQVDSQATGQIQVSERSCLRRNPKVDGDGKQTPKVVLWSLHGCLHICRHTQPHQTLPPIPTHTHTIQESPNCYYWALKPRGYHGHVPGAGCSFYCVPCHLEVSLPRKTGLCPRAKNSSPEYRIAFFQQSTGIRHKPEDKGYVESQHPEVWGLLGSDS